MEELLAQISITLSAIALIISILTFLITRSFQVDDRKKSLTVEMWKRWEESELRDRRVQFWIELTGDEHGVTPTEGSVKASTLTPDACRSLNDVEHFLEGLGKLRAAGQLDKSLLKSLFVPNLRNWRDISFAVERDNENYTRRLQHFGQRAANSSASPTSL